MAGNVSGTYMGKIKGRRKSMVFRLCIYAEVIAGTILGSCLCGISFIDILKNIAVSVTGIMVFVYYYGMRGGRMLRSVLSQQVFLASFAVSNLLVAFTGIMDIGTIWMAAVAVVAAREGMGHAVSCHLLLMLQYLILSADAAANTRIIIFYAVLGILLSLVISEIKKQKMFIYAAVIFISLTFVIIIVLNGCNLKETWNNRGFLFKCIAGDAVLLIISWVTYRIKRKNVAGQNNYKNATLDEKSLSRLASKDHGLMQRIKGYSEALYIHSMRTGNLSGMAAEFAGYNKNLATAGGFYHEAGRIYGNGDYKEACSQLVKEYAFPIQLADIIRQHGEMPEKPGSPEAALVMLSDSIISTDEYFDRTGRREQISDEKLVKSVFNSRIAKGSLDNSGIDKEHMEELMDFYINNAFKEEIIEEHL